MSLLVLFNQAGGTAAPFVPAANPAVMLANVYRPVAPLRGTFGTVAMSNVYQPTSTIKVVQKTST